MQIKTLPIFIFAILFGALPAVSQQEQETEPDPLTRPTKNGMRLTPGLARAFASQWLSEHVDPEISITADQQVELSEAVARRLMNLARENQEQTQQLLEYTLENFADRKKPVTGEAGQKLAERATPMIPAMREFLDGIGQDARTVLKPQDMKLFEQRLRHEHNNINNFEVKMQRWSQGQVYENEQPFTELEAIEQQPALGEKSPPTPAVRRALRRANWSLSNLGPAQWEKLLADIKQLYKFNEQQSTKAQEILAKYRTLAEAIMTPEWKKSLQQNRLKYNLRSALTESALAPWIYHLDREFNETIAPLSDLGAKFKAEIFALVTDDQRAATMREIEKLAAAHGLKLEESDKNMLGLNAHH